MPVGQVVAVRDLDVVRDDRWPQTVRHIAGDPELRRALLSAGAGAHRRARRPSTPSYTAWWLTRELDLAGTVAAGADDLGGVLVPAPAWLA